MDYQKLSILSIILLLIVSSCRPELVDEDGPLGSNKFTLEPKFDTIVEGDYTEPKCLAELDSNYISFNIHSSDIQQIKVESKRDEPVKIKVFADYASPSMYLEIWLNADSLPMVRRDYQVTDPNIFKMDEAYLYLEFNGFELKRYNSVNEGTVHFYRKDINSFRVQICDAEMKEIGTNSSFRFDFQGWIEN